MSKDKNCSSNAYMKTAKVTSAKPLPLPVKKPKKTGKKS